MTNVQVDVAIVGAGTDGIAAYQAARSAGATADLASDLQGILR